MNLKSSLYDTLTPIQRVIATIEAEARDDTAEVERLVKSCPKKIYTMNDDAYTRMMDRLILARLAIECDLQNQMIGFWVAALCDREDCIQMFLQNMADIQAAWHKTLNEFGIDPETMAKAGPPRHGAIDFLSDLMPEPNMENVQSLCEKIQEFMNRG